MTRGGDIGREPCPYRIVDDIGGAFAMGGIGGGIFHIIKGARNSPAGERFAGGIYAVKARAPILGGNFAVWGGLFSSFDCTLAHLRQKEDPWNSITAGAATGGVLAARAGPKAAGKNALIGGVLLALIEGLSVALTKMTAPADPNAQYGLEAPDASGALAPPVDPNSMIPPTPVDSGSSDLVADSEAYTDSFGSQSDNAADNWGFDQGSPSTSSDPWADGGYDTRSDSKYSGDTQASLVDQGENDVSGKSSWLGGWFGKKSD